MPIGKGNLSHQEYVLCTLHFSAPQPATKMKTMWRGGAGGQGFMGCFIGDDIKHFYVKLSVVLISFLLLLLLP